MKRTVTLIPSKTDTRISLRCQVALHFIARIGEARWLSDRER